MSEKVLGFYKKDAYERPEFRSPFPCDSYEIPKDKLVSVRLASESVDLKKLKDFLETLRIGDMLDAGGDINVEFVREKIIEWAEKEAKKK